MSDFLLAATSFLMGISLTIYVISLGLAYTANDKITKEEFNQNIENKICRITYFKERDEDEEKYNISYLCWEE